CARRPPGSGGRAARSRRAWLAWPRSAWKDRGLGSSMRGPTEAGWAGRGPPEPRSTYGRARDGPSARWLGGRPDRPRAREEPRREYVPDGNRNVPGGQEP